ncbi:MAG: archaeosortase/exosortase family protein [Candidatus Methanoperedens sp.]|nr:archaeosortase/exosortase family protein [Candidatus Methanoperedens sp.]
MSPININQKQKILLFLLISIVSAVKLAPQKIISDISPEYLSINGMYPWAILFLCVFFLFAKRRELAPASNSIFYSISGILIYILSFFMSTAAPEFKIFRLLLALTGLAFIFFGEAASLPALLLCIFGFGISFPKLVDAYAGIAYAQFSTKIAYSISSLFVPATQGDTTISMITLSGEKLIMIINAACSGSASMSVFLVIFMLMSLDLPLPKRKWALLLFFGIIGTSVQNIARLVLLILAGYYFGHSAVESGESFAGYIIFPMWYAVFAFVYLKQAKNA